MAGRREESDGLLADARGRALPLPEDVEDVEECAPTVSAAPGGRPAARRAALAALAAGALGVLLLCAAQLGARGWQRGAPMETAAVEDVVVDQQVYPPAPSPLAAGLSPTQVSAVDGVGAAAASPQGSTGTNGAGSYAGQAGSSGGAAGYTGAAGYAGQASGSGGYAGATGSYTAAQAGASTTPYTASAAAYADQAGGGGSYAGATGTAAYASGAAGSTTARSYSGPLEFNGKGGPPTVAGTKVINAGADDAGVIPHSMAPTPPPEYSLENPPFTMYMYRAQSEKNYPMRNVNLGDLAGVLWYLHNEIVAFPDPQYKIRHFGITRIIRFKVTVQNPPEFFAKHGTRFGSFVAFGAGKCTVPHCDSLWTRYGAVVGCQAADTEVANYRSLWKTQTVDSPDKTACVDGCNGPLWFSLPGPCPSHEYGAKSAQCSWDFPGGDCGRGNEVTGSPDCTYYAKWYGEIALDDLLNYTLPDGKRATFPEFLTAGGREYDKETDAGVYTSFWDGIHDLDANRRRLETARYLFAAKYPRYPTELQETEIRCDFNGWKDGEFSPFPAPGSEP